MVAAAAREGMAAAAAAVAAVMVVGRGDRRRSHRGRRVTYGYSWCLTRDLTPIPNPSPSPNPNPHPNPNPNPNQVPDSGCGRVSAHTLRISHDGAFLLPGRQPEAPPDSKY